MRIIGIVWRKKRSLTEVRLCQALRPNLRRIPSNPVINLRVSLIPEIFVNQFTDRILLCIILIQSLNSISLIQFLQLFVMFLSKKFNRRRDNSINQMIQKIMSTHIEIRIIKCNTLVLTKQIL